MIIDEIVLHEFGLYANRQSIILTPPAANKPVVLFGGLNGGGKTTLLDALQLCLFGAHAKTSNRGSLPYTDYLARCIHRNSKTREAAIELQFRHTAEGNEDTYRLHRSWRLTSTGCRERFEVLRNGIGQSALADNWISQVEDFVPPNIAHLFLFDGEQIESYASDSDSATLIGSAIQNLLGLDVVDQLEKDLHIYERRKRSKKEDDSWKAPIEAAETELAALRERLQALTQERASVRTYKIDRAQRALKEAEDRYRKLGGELFDRRQEIERDKADAELACQDCSRSLRELASGATPLLLVRDLLQSIDSVDRNEEASRRARDVSETLQERDQAILRYLKRHLDDNDAVTALEIFLNEDRRTRADRGKKKIVLDLSAEARSDLHSLLNHDLESLLAEANDKLRKQQLADDRVNHLHIQYNSIPDSDAILPVAAEHDKLKSAIAGFKAAFAAMSSEIDRLTREIERKQQSLARLLLAQAQAEDEEADRLRILNHSVRVRSTLRKFRHAVTARHVHRIEHLVLESYQQLLRKSALVTRLSIDPESFALTLYDRSGARLTAERLSAGERQLLAVALLWGLARASGRPLPTAIDTPLGRLDTTHRMYVTKRYFPFASHQVLLLSTDEEITGAYLESLQPWIGRTYKLDYNDANGVTRVVPGYFGDREAA